jgi:hypothetical protein
MAAGAVTMGLADVVRTCGTVGGWALAPTAKVVRIAPRWQMIGPGTAAVRSAIAASVEKGGPFAFGHLGAHFLFVRLRSRAARNGAMRRSASSHGVSLSARAAMSSMA